MLNSILDATFRASPDYEIILFDRLSFENKQMLGSLQDDCWAVCRTILISMASSTHVQLIHT